MIQRMDLSRHNLARCSLSGGDFLVCAVEVKSSGLRWMPGHCSLRAVCDRDMRVHYVREIEGEAGPVAPTFAPIIGANTKKQEI